MASLVIDNREKDATIALLQKVLGPTPVEKLASADFRLTDRCGHTMGIERKTASDFLGSLTKKQNGKARMMDQLERVQAEHDIAVLLLEGGVACEPGTLKAMSMPARRVTGWWYSAVQMLLLRFLQQGVLRINTTDLYSTAQTIKNLRDRAERGCLKSSMARDTEPEESE